MTPWPPTENQLPLEGIAGSAEDDNPQQLALIGQPSLIRIPAATWATWLADPRVRERYWAKVYVPQDRTDCFFYLGAITNTGHASFRAGSLPGRTRRGTVPGHLYGYQLANGVIPRLGWDNDSPTVCHRCDNHSCQNPTHLRLGTPSENRAEWLARRRDPTGPLADVRGPAGRARAITQTIRCAQKAEMGKGQIEARVRGTVEAGRPLTLW